jgi:hypothetical protein
VSGFPNSIYRPSGKDLLAQYSPQRVARGIDTLLAAASPTLALYTVPNDQVLLLSHVSITCIGGGAQTVNGASVSLFDAASNTITRILNRRFSDQGLAAQPAQLDAEWSGEQVCMPGEIVFYQGDFSAGVAANTLRSALSGILVPRGNWQLG